MSTAIVLGANGYLGRHICWVLKKENYQVIGCGTTNSPNHSYVDSYTQLDITNIEDLRALDLNVDFIFNFAGKAGTLAGFENPSTFIQTNEVGLLNLLTLMKDSRSNAKLVFPSTRLVYKGQQGIRLKEASQKEALTIYASNKLSCEDYLAMYHNVFGIKYTTFRVCVPYGNVIGSTYSYGTIGFFLDQAKNGKNITLYGDGGQKRTFTHVQDIAEVIVKISQISKSNGKTINIGSPDNLSLCQAATLVAEKYGVGISYSDWPEKALKVESGDTVFDDKVLQKIYPYQYRFLLASWLDQL